MPDAAAFREAAREFWAEVRRDDQPVVAPYPRAAVPKPWKWDRPLELALGRLSAEAPWAGKKELARANAIIARGDELEALPDEEVDARCLGLRRALMRQGLDDELVDDAFALIREVTGRELGMRHFPVQIMGGLVMLAGHVAEMATGEGKTITALLPAVTSALAGQPVHVFTVNDYLAERDAAHLAPVFRRFGLEVGLIIHDVETADRRAAYRADVVYGTNKEITFDYLRDLTALGRCRGATRRRIAELLGKANQPLLLRGLHFAIVDEADSIFIDEARTPLILSADVPADDDGLYLSAHELVSRLEEGRHYRIREAERAVELTERGKTVVAELAEGLPHARWRIRQSREQLASQAIAAQRLYLRDREYVVIDDKVQIVDESTGRVMPDRSWEGGLHQLVEAKEQVALTGTRNTLARITYQHFFRQYLKLAGMSGTVREVAGELRADYGVGVTPVPRNRPNVRVDRGHVMHRTAGEKWAAVANAVMEVQAGEGRRPILIGTRSVADSESVSAALTQVGVAHRVLNARQDAEEAEIIAQAGETGAVTVATNMAGRGTDILLSADARAAGGLHVILTAFHETARIDRQLYGRAGRQGDPGSSQAITAADDELYVLFASTALKTLVASAKQWPVEDGPAEWLRKWAQSAAERRHAASRRQTELAEKKLRETIAFTGAN